ncbi:MAG TPA: virulence factor SrfC family protein [Polyangiaceae bacterium]|nr:virulence factor SrfC family protein [Polyangiaceae bacterium]
MTGIETLDQGIRDALAHVSGKEASPEATVLRDLQLRMRRLRRAWGRPQAIGLFGPSQAGKSFLVGALLSHELGTLKVLARDRELDFLREINPAKGVESTGVVTRFSTAPGPRLTRGDFHCRLLTLDVVLESLATGFLVECTAPPLDLERIDRTLLAAKQQQGAPAAPHFAEAWDTVFHGLSKKYQDRHPYLNELRRHVVLRDGAWKSEVRSLGGWLFVYSLLWGGPGYAKDLDQLAARLLGGLEAVGHSENVELQLAQVRASSDTSSLLDASCLNAIGTSQPSMTVFAQEAGRDVSLEPPVLAALIAEVRLGLRPVGGSLLERADILDFPGGRALKGINGFGAAELNTGRLEHAVEVYKRGKLTFLFEQYAHDREITALVLCSPGPTKPEAIQLQSQVERWLEIRYGAPTPQAAQEIDNPSLFLALTKFDMSLGTLRSDNAKDRWDSRVQEACMDFWARGQSSWVHAFGQKGRAFDNLYWIRNPYADQMLTLKEGDPDYAEVKEGYFASRAVARFIRDPAEKWAAVEGSDAATGMPRSGVPLLAARMRQKLAEDVKKRELGREAESIREELLSVLLALTPSRDEEEERARLRQEARTLVTAVEREMARRCSGSAFGELIALLAVPSDDLDREVRSVFAEVATMSIKASDKVKKVLVHVLKWWQRRASETLRQTTLELPHAQVETFLRQVLTSRLLLPILGRAIFPYFSRTQVDTSLVASILELKICDFLLTLGVEAERGTPALPVKLSFAEEATREAAETIDWGDVSFEDSPTSARAAGVTIVFAGRKHFDRWSADLGEFYVRSGGAKAGTALDDAHVGALVRILKTVEGTHVGEAGG